MLLLKEDYKTIIQNISDADLLNKIQEANKSKTSKMSGLLRIITNDNKHGENELRERIKASEDIKVKEEFQKFLEKIDKEKPVYKTCQYCGYEATSQADLSRHKRKSHPDFVTPRQKRFDSVDLDYNTKIQRLKEVIKQQEEEILTWADIKSILHVKWGDNIEYIEKICNETSPEASELFKTIKKKISKQISNVERWFYDVLIEKLNEKSKTDEYIEHLKSNKEYTRIKNDDFNSAGIPNKLCDYRDKIILSPLDKKQILDGNKSIGGKDQDIDILITFKDGPQKYNGVNIDGIGISCEGEKYHKYSTSKGELNYNKTVANDFLRYGNKTYFIVPWDEKERTKGYSEKKIKTRASNFIDKFILNILSSIFHGNRPIYNPTQHQKQDQDKKLFEIANALHNNIGKFEYNGENGKIEIRDLGAYFLFNKYSLAPQPEREYLWSKPIDPEFKPDENWKAEIYKNIVNNEKLIKERNLKKKTIDYINKFGNFPTKGNIKEYGKHQPARQFARLFEEIKKKNL